MRVKSTARVQNKSGFTRAQQIAFVVVLIGLVAAVAVPKFIKARTPAGHSACVQGLHEIDGAKEQWALENKKSTGTPVDVAGVNKFMKGGQAPICPEGGVYTYHNVDEKPTCSMAAVGHTM